MRDTSKPLRVVVLGAAGGVGAATAAHIARVGSARLTVADRDEARLGEVLANLPGEARAAVVDVTKKAELAALLQEADLVLNAVGPYTRFGPLVLQSALDARTDYVDICDDPEPTLTLLDFDDAARSAGVRALLGLGASPGISNLLAVRAASELDEVDTLHTLWNAVDDFEDFASVDGPIAHGAATEHWMEQLHGTVPAVVDGELRPTAPLERLSLDLPRYGNVEAHTVGHPEPLTLLRAFAGLRQSRNAMLGDSRLFELLHSFSQRMNDGLDVRDAAVRFYQEVADLRDLAYLTTADGELVPSLLAYGEGTRDGRKATVIASCRSLPEGGTAGVTAAPFSLAVPLHSNGWADEPGVSTPERTVDSVRFFSLLGPLCSAPPAGDLVAIERS